MSRLVTPERLPLDLTDHAPPAVCQLPSPRKNVEELAVPLPSLAVGTVPDPKFVAFKAVRFTPLAAGSVAGNLASATVPLPKFVAFKAVRFTPLAAGRVAGNLASGTVPLPKFVAFKLVSPDPTPPTVPVVLIFSSPNEIEPVSEVIVPSLFITTVILKVPYEGLVGHEKLVGSDTSEGKSLNFFLYVFQASDIV